MATGLLGQIDQFDSAVEEWPQYVERLEQFFVANDITGEDKAVKRRATFLSVVGRGTYNLLRSIIAPAKPTEKTLIRATGRDSLRSLQSEANGSDATLQVQLSEKKGG